MHLYNAGGKQVSVLFDISVMTMFSYHKWILKIDQKFQNTGYESRVRDVILHKVYLNGEELSTTSSLNNRFRNVF
jgi:hypothetical protein